MTSNFERWEKDPFFPAAEEVQESADRMESAYRTLIHALKEPSTWNTEELRRDLRTALGTTKWQLEEFERAVVQSYSKVFSEDAKTRHREFISAMENQISKVEKSLNESSVANGKPPRPWVRLNEGESNELALFLSGSPAYGDEKRSKFCVNGDQKDTSDESTPDRIKNLKFSGHRRTASASADIGSWKIAVSDDVSLQSDDGKPEQPPRKIPSFSGFLNTMESASKLKWSRNGYRKLKLIDHHPEAESKLPEIQPLTRGNNVCYEKSKSRLESGDDCYDKQLYGWYGSVQRQLQRSLYYMRYSRPTQRVLLILVLICFFAFITMHVM